MGKLKGKDRKKGMEGRKEKFEKDEKIVMSE